MISIFAINKHGDKEKIEDLYWFEEQGIHDFNGVGHYMNYSFEILIDGEK